MRNIAFTFFCLCLAILIHENLGRLHGEEHVLDEFTNLKHVTTLRERNDNDAITGQIFKDGIKHYHSRAENDFGVKKRGVVTGFLLVNGVINAAFDVYRFERGCLDWKKYRENLKAIKGELPKLQATRDLVNLRWNVFSSIFRHYHRLNSQARIVEILAEDYENLKQSIVFTLDPNIKDKLQNASSELSQEIESNNLTDQDIDYRYLEKAFLTKFQLALSLVKNLRSVVWMGGKALVYKIIELTASDEAAIFVEENPTRFKQFLAYLGLQKAKIQGWYTEKIEIATAKIAAFKHAVKSRMINYIRSHPRLNKAYTYVFAKHEGSLSRWEAAKKKLKFIGKTILFPALIGYDSYLLGSFIKDCNEREKNSEYILNTVRKRQARLDNLKSLIENNIVIINENYTELKSKFMENNFTMYLRNMQDLIKNSSDPTPGQLKAVTDIGAFIDNIANASHARTESLVETLINSIGAINKDLNCIEKRLYILQNAYYRCENGLDTFDRVYNDSLDLERKNTQHCYSAGYIKRSELEDFIFKQLAENSKSKICLRNNQIVQNNVCKALRTNKNPLLVKNGLTNNDIEYFKLRCGLLALKETDKISICYMKSKGKSLLYLLQDIFKAISYDSSDVTQVYNNCPLPSAAVNMICNMKSNRKPLGEVTTQFPLYYPAMVAGAYNKCQPTENLKTVICLWKNLAKKDITSKYISFFEASVLKKIYKECKPPAADQDVSDSVIKVEHQIIPREEDITHTLSAPTILAICKMKFGSTKFRVEKVLKTFFNEDASMVTKTYNDCTPPRITQFRENICVIKHLGRNFGNVYSMYQQHYNENEVRYVFDGCM